MASNSDIRAALLEELTSTPCAPGCSDTSLDTAAALRAHLQAKIAARGNLRRISTTGSPGSESVTDCIRSVIQVVSAELDAVAGNAASARDAAAALNYPVAREVGDDASAVSTAYSSLLDLIGDAADRKSAALETMLVALDGGLVSAIETCSTVDHALALLTDAELAAVHATLCDRLTRLHTALDALPLHTPHTEATLRVAAVPPSQLHLIRDDDPLRALRAQLVTAEVTAADVMLATAGRQRRAKPGGQAAFPLLLTPAALGRPGFDAVAAAASLRARTYALATVSRAGVDGHRSPTPSQSEPLVVNVQDLAEPHPSAKASSSSSAGVLLTVSVPDDAPEGSLLYVHGLAVAGEAVSAPGPEGGFSSFHASVRISRSDGIAVPQRLPVSMSYEYCMAPCVTSRGTLYMPSGSDLMVIDDDGSRTMPVATSPSDVVRAVTYDELTGTLLVSSRSGGAALTAFDVSDPSSPQVKWTHRKRINGGGGVVLRTTTYPHGVVVVGIPDSSCINVLDLATGAQLSEVKHACCISIAAAGNSVWATTYENGQGSLVRYRLNEAAALVEKEPIASAGRTGDWRLVALAPRPGASPVLVVLTWALRDLLCIDSATGEVIAGQELPVWVRSVVGVCIAESGDAIVLVDKGASAIHVLPWPLTDCQ